VCVFNYTCVCVSFCLFAIHTKFSEKTERVCDEESVDKHTDTETKHTNTHAHLSVLSDSMLSALVSNFWQELPQAIQ
jgi:hypothetical protein